MDINKIIPSLEKEESEDRTPPGRKFLMGRYTLLLATLGFFSTALATVLSTNFGVFIGALATLYGLYCGGNVSQKWVSTRPTTKVVLDRRKAQAAEPVSTPAPTDGPGPAGG